MVINLNHLFIPGQGQTNVTNVDKLKQFLNKYKLRIKEKIPENYKTQTKNSFDILMYYI